MPFGLKKVEIFRAHLLPMARVIDLPHQGEGKRYEMYRSPPSPPHKWYKVKSTAICKVNKIRLRYVKILLVIWNRGSSKLLNGSCWLGDFVCGCIPICLPGVVAAAAGPHTPADVTEQRDQHPQHPVPGPRHRLAGVCPHGAGRQNRGRGTV